MGPAPRPTRLASSPKCSASRLLIEELNSRALLGNWLLRAGAERADVISEPGAAAAQPRTTQPPRLASPTASRSPGWGAETPVLGEARSGKSAAQSRGRGSEPFLDADFAAVGGGGVKLAQERRL